MRLRTFLLVSVGLAASALAASAAASAPVITSVKVGGSPSKPVFTITGRGLSIPAASPKRSPSNTPGCPLKIKGKAGFDYGTQFYVDAFATGTNEDKQLYSAGRYRPTINETDCIGLTVLSHTPTKVTFTFGSTYGQFPQYRSLMNGDLVEVVLKGAKIGLVVHYG